LIDLHRLRDEEIIGGDELAFGLKLMKYARDPDFRVYLRRLLQSWRGSTEGEAVDLYFTAVIFYIVSTSDQLAVEDIRDIFKNSTLSKQGDNIMTIAEKLKKQGRQEGRQEGRTVSTRKNILQFLKFRFGSTAPGIVAALNAIDDPEKMDHLYTFALRCDSMEEFTERLRQ